MGRTRQKEKPEYAEAKKRFRFQSVPSSHKSSLPKARIPALVRRKVNAICMKVSHNYQGADELFNLEVCGSTIALKAVPSSQNYPSTHIGKHTLCHVLKPDYIAKIAESAART